MRDTQLDFARAELGAGGERVREEALADLAASLCTREDWGRLLIDCASIPPTFTLEQRTQLASYAAAALPDTHIAIVVADEERFSDVATASSPPKLRYFTSMPDAASWLARARAGA